jgi:Uncharacterized Fe-S protein
MATVSSRSAMPGRPPDFPYLTAREEASMLAYKPRFRHPEKAALPTNLAEARGITPTVADPADLAVDVETPSGDRLAIDDPALLRALARRVDGAALRLLRSERALTDCRPVSLFSLQTAERLGAEIGAVLDKRRFRANIYVDLDSRPGFAEDSFVGKSLKIGSQLMISVLERDGRCKMITLDPDYGRSKSRGPPQGRPGARGKGRGLCRGLDGGCGSARRCRRDCR